MSCAGVKYVTCYNTGNFETTIFDVRVMLPDWQHDAAKLETELTVDVWVLLKTVTPRPRSGTSPLRGEFKIQSSAWAAALKRGGGRGAEGKVRPPACTSPPFPPGLIGPGNMLHKIPCSQRCFNQPAPGYDRKTGEWRPGALARKVG